MTAATLAPPATSIPTLVVLRRATASEWSRLWSVRSTWWALLGSLGIAAVMGAAYGVDTAGDGNPVRFAGEFTIVVAQLPILVLVTLAVTADHATGTIRSSLQWVPRRGVLLLARTSVTTLVATVAGMLTALTADLTALLWVRSAPGAGELVASLTDVAVVVAVGALVTAGIATILRSTAGTLTSIFLLLLVLPMMLPEFGIDWLTAVGRRLPGMAIALLAAMEFDEPKGDIVAALAAWVVLTTVVATWLFTRRDAG